MTPRMQLFQQYMRQSDLVLFLVGIFAVGLAAMGPALESSMLPTLRRLSGWPIRFAFGAYLLLIIMLAFFWPEG